MMRRAFVMTALLMATACGPDSVPFQIALDFERDIDSGYQCERSSCNQFPTACDGAIGIRIVNAASGELLVNECVMVEGGSNRTLCDLIGQIELPPELLPNTMVRIEVAIWPYVNDPEHPDRHTADCPDIEFDLTGKFEEGTPMPAIAGQGYFEIGSSATAPVTLGCIDEDRLDAPECQDIVYPHIVARVIDFEDRIDVDASLANRLLVAVAEPDGNVQPGQWVIRATELEELSTTQILPFPIWEGDYPYDFTATACIQVLSEDLGAVAALRCYQAAPADLVGNQLVADATLIDDATLDLIEQALGGSLPSGLVVGQVVDADGVPAAGVTVTPSFGTVRYLSADLTSTDGLTATTSSGAFVSTDAPFRDEETAALNFWTADNGTVTSTGAVIGGIVLNKVTIVVLQLAGPGT